MGPERDIEDYTEEREIVIDGDFILGILAGFIMVMALGLIILSWLVVPVGYFMATVITIGAVFGFDRAAQYLILGRRENDDQRE